MRDMRNARIDMRRIPVGSSIGAAAANGNENLDAP
jgi:hypothetical protein